MPSLLFLLPLLLILSPAPRQASGLPPAPPQQVTLEADRAAQRLTVTWEGTDAPSFDVLIQRTELMDTVFNETVVLQPEGAGRYRWNWTSAEPLECTSLSVSLRSRDGAELSAWTRPQILPGLDVPSNTDAQMYPEGRVVAVGTNTTFCCIIPEGQDFGRLTYKATPMNVRRLSRRSYATTRTNQEPSATTGTNVICSNNRKTVVTGAVVFVGYPPQPTDLVCESHDLVSASCQWNKGRDTHLYGTKRQTYYTLNGRKCSQALTSRDPRMACWLDQWEGNWTLEAQNPLGRASLTDSAQLGDRVRPVSPSGLAAAEVGAWNASLQWEWPYAAYDSLALICQVQLTSYWHTNTHTSTGAGLKKAVLPGLQPDEEYSVKVRCGSQKNFWKWGNWSAPLSFRTKMDRPQAPDAWVWMDSNSTGRILWKPLTRRESHGPLSGYQVTLWSPEENRQHSVSLPQSLYSLAFNLSSPHSTTLLTLTASNPAGLSPPASLGIPAYPGGAEVPVSRAVFMETGFPLSWPAPPNASCAHVVQWHNSTCSQDCSVDWTKVPPENTNVTIQSDDFLAGVRYTFSLFSSCWSESPELQQRWEGYRQELAPSRSAPGLSSNQHGSDVQLTWEEIPLEHRRGFILGYRVYMVSASQLTLLANISDPGQRNHTVRKLPLGSYKFTVKSFNSAGEDGGSTVSISLEPYTDWLILEILVTLGIMACFLALVTTLCYRKRTWVKKAFYPDIPEPKLPGDWSRAQGTLDVKPSPHSMVHIENPEWDSSKEALVVVPEEDEEEEEEGSASGNEPADTDEPAALRYYNQVEDRGSPRQRPRLPPDSSASSASSVDSTRTDVTYTGIQTSGSSLVLQPLQPPQPDLSAPPLSGGYRPQMQPASDPDPGPPETQVCLEEQPPARGGVGGYQPQCSWKLDSPGENGGLAPSLGSPTSVTSSQFLLPDAAEEQEGKGQTSWFHNLLSGKP